MTPPPAQQIAIFGHLCEWLAFKWSVTMLLGLTKQESRSMAERSKLTRMAETLAMGLAGNVWWPRATRSTRWSTGLSSPPRRPGSPEEDELARRISWTNTRKHSHPSRSTSRWSAGCSPNCSGPLLGKAPHPGREGITAPAWPNCNPTRPPAVSDQTPSDVAALPSSRSGLLGSAWRLVLIRSREAMWAPAPGAGRPTEDDERTPLPTIP